MTACLLPISLLLCLPTLQEDAGDSVKQTPEQMEVQVTVRMRYLVALPDGYEKQEKWPLVLFLHGAGERGADLNKVKVHGPPKLIEQGRKFPFITVSPQCPTGRWWDASQLDALLTHVEKKYHVDSDRIYVTGLSMGGFGTFQLAAYCPERIAAIAPICGGGDPITARRTSHIPAWVFHGAKDNVVPVSRSREMVEALKARGAEVRFTEYPNAGHDAWTATYNNPELYTWLLSHTRSRATR